MLKISDKKYRIENQWTLLVFLHITDGRIKSSIKDKITLLIGHFSQIYRLNGEEAIEDLNLLPTTLTNQQKQTNYIKQGTNKKNQKQTKQ